jgi:iron complex outermembrane receptor protein
MFKFKGIACFVCMPAVAGLWAGSAAAQQQQSSQAGQLEEIIVTAEKRESTIETTSISITAVSGDDIVNRGFTDLASLMQTVPGVSIRTSGPGMTEFEMRGVASNGGNSPTVGFYFDDTPLTAAAATNEGKIVISPDLYDLNRVEVLRGPQGTLYGSGSMGRAQCAEPRAFRGVGGGKIRRHGSWRVRPRRECHGESAVLGGQRGAAHRRLL